MAYTDRLLELFNDVTGKIDETPVGSQPRAELVVLLSAIKIVLSSGGSGGGGGGITPIETTQAVKAAIETAANLSGLDARLGAIELLEDLTNDLLARRISSQPEISNLVLTNAHTQYQHLFPAGTKKIAFKCRACSPLSDPVGLIYYSWIINRVIDPGTGLPSVAGGFDCLGEKAEEADEVYFGSDKTLYLASPVAGVVVSLRRWT